MATDWQVKRLAGALGAEVGEPTLPPRALPTLAIKALLLEHKVLFFLDRPLVRRNT